MSTKILGETGVPHHEPRLRGQVPDELLLGRRQRFPRPLLDRQRAEQLAAMADRLEHRRSRDGALLLVRRCGTRARAGVHVLRPGRLGSQLLADAHPHICARGAGALPERARHPREQLLARVRLPDPLGELGQHLVGRGALAVDEPVGEPLRPSPEPAGTRARRRAAAAADSTGLAWLADERSHARRRSPRTRRVMKTASAPNSTARLITTSMSNSRYRRIDTPIASRDQRERRARNVWSNVSHSGFVVDALVHSPPSENRTPAA